MSTRVQRMLGRFPAHFAAGRPGKGLSAVGEALAGSIEVLSTDLAAVRRAHRIGHAGELSDVLLLGGLHGLTRDELGLLFRRWEVVEAAAGALEAVAGGDPAAREAAASALLGIWGIEAAAAGLASFAPAHEEADPPDLEAAAMALATAARRSLKYPELVERARERVLGTVGQHALGNGTVRALLAGTANALDLDLDLARNARSKQAALEGPGPVLFDTVVSDDLFHDLEHYWHASYVRERGPLVRPVATLTPENRVTVGPASTISEMATESGVAAEDLLATAEGLGLGLTDPDQVMGLSAAVALAEASGLEPEQAPRGVIRVSPSTSVAQAARRLGVKVDALTARLEAVGMPGADASTPLAALTVAGLARRYGFTVEEALTPALDLIGLEENPLHRVTYEQQDLAHGQRFTILRKGFGRAIIRAEVEGLDDLTVGPMLVNRDEGRGFGWFGPVEGGKVLRFEEEGRIFLDGDDVTDRGFSWKGACFADASIRHRKDFVFPDPGIREDRWSHTMVAEPVGALDRDAVYPHDGLAVEMPGLAVGATRMAFFVQVAHLSSREGPPEAPVVRRVTPHTYIGFADESVFSAVDAADPGASPYPAFLPPGFPVAAHVRISWLEHEAYAVRILVPPRLDSLDEADVPAADRLLAALERFRPAGIELRVDTIDDHWILGEGSLVSEAGQDPLSILRGGTALWPVPPEGD